jgi:hypothetical protein
VSRSWQLKEDHICGCGWRTDARKEISDQGQQRNQGQVMWLSAPEHGGHIDSDDVSGPHHDVN